MRYNIFFIALLFVVAGCSFAVTNPDNQVVPRQQNPIVQNTEQQTSSAPSLIIQPSANVTLQADQSIKFRWDYDTALPAYLHIVVRVIDSLDSYIYVDTFSYRTSLQEFTWQASPGTYVVEFYDAEAGELLTTSGTITITEISDDQVTDDATSDDYTNTTDESSEPLSSDDNPEEDFETSVARYQQVPNATCQALYPTTTDPSDSQRFNIVVLPIGYSSFNEAQKAARLIFDKEALTAQTYHTPGFLQTPPIDEFAHKFNIWILDADIAFDDVPSGNFCITDSEDYQQDPKVYDYIAQYDACLGLKEETGIRPYYLTLQERDTQLVREQQKLATCGYGSWGRNGANIAWPEHIDGEYIAPSGVFPKKGIRDLLTSNIHELSHTLFSLFDEYTSREGTPQDDPTFFVNYKKSTGHDFDPQTGLQLYFTDPDSSSPATVDDCLASAPWKDHLGDGCGKPGVIDCFKDPRNPQFDSCTDKSSQQCWYEVACVEGAGWKKGSFRPQLNGLMNGVYGQIAPRFGAWTELLVRYALERGPTEQKYHEDIYSNFSL